MICFWRRRTQNDVKSRLASQILMPSTAQNTSFFGKKLLWGSICQQSRTNGNFSKPQNAKRRKNSISHPNFDADWIQSLNPLLKMQVVEAKVSNPLLKMQPGATKVWTLCSNCALARPKSEPFLQTASYTGQSLEPFAQCGSWSAQSLEPFDQNGTWSDQSLHPLL